MTTPTFTNAARELERVLVACRADLAAISDRDASLPHAPAKWSRKQIIGHLIDSASNNHQRFVRAQQATSLSFPPYEQNHWVASQRYNERSWADLVSLWHAYNTHLSHVISQIP